MPVSLKQIMNQEAELVLTEQLNYTVIRKTNLNGEHMLLELLKALVSNVVGAKPVMCTCLDLWEPLEWMEEFLGQAFLLVTAVDGGAGGCVLYTAWGVLLGSNPKEILVWHSCLEQLHPINLMTFGAPRVLGTEDDNASYMFVHSLL